MHSLSRPYCNLVLSCRRGSRLPSDTGRPHGHRRGVRHLWSPVTPAIDRSGRLWTTSWRVSDGREPFGVSPLRRSHVPIASAAELSVWWAVALSERTASGRTLSLLWLDSSGHRLGRVLSLTGAPPQPERAVVSLVRRLRRTIIAEGPLYVEAHTAVAPRARAHRRSDRTTRRGPEHYRRPSAKTAWEPGAST